MVLLDLVSRIFKNFNQKGDEDVIDWLNFVVSDSMIFFFILVNASKEYFYNPVHCWFPTDFETEGQQFVNAYCKFLEDLGPQYSGWNFRLSPRYLQCQL